VKYYVLALGASLAVAQSVTNTYTTDINGRRAAGDSLVSSDHQRTEIMQNLNGRKIPLQETDERVLRKDGNSTLTERTIRKFDRNGQLASTERQMIEEQKRPSGSTTRVTTYQTDVNGRSAETEHRTTETETQGAITRTQSVVERPTVNGSFAPVEKRSGVAEKLASGTREEETTYQNSENGGYVVRARQVRETTESGGQTTEKTALYQPLANSSQLQLAEQTVATTTKRPDGSERTETSVYGSSWGGHVGDAQSGPQLREQDVVERTPGPGGSVTESLSVRRASATDAGKLGPMMKVSETVCTGNCKKQ